MVNQVPLEKSSSESNNADRLAHIIETLSCMAAGDIERRVNVTDSGDAIDAVSYGINILAEELTYAVKNLAREREAAHVANQAKSTFLAHMSHEIRTPLTAIVGFAELLDNERLSQSERSDFLNRMRVNCHSLRKLIDEILDLSKVEAGELTVEKIEVPLSQHLRDIVTGLEAAAAKKDLALRLIIDDSVPDMVLTDPLRLWQVVNNLVGNAIKFSQGGIIQIYLNQSADHLFSIEVQDPGVGIPVEQQGNLFRPFSQGDRTISRRFGGTGLGLALSRALCRALGGDLILVRSEPDFGTLFRATIRACPAEKKTAGGPLNHSNLVSHNGTLPLSGLKILLAEDAEDSRFLISTFLKRAGAQVTECADGEEAIKAMNSEIGVVLMDIQMPQIDGIQATRLLRELHYKVPIIALTAHAMRGERERCLELGFTDYVAKPVQRTMLIDRILLNRGHSQ